LEALFNNVMQATSLNVELFGWGIGSLAPIVLFLVRRRFTRTDLLLLFSIAFVAGAYSLYWYGSGPDFGPRYWFLMLPALLALSARSLLDIGKLVGLRWVHLGVGALGVITLLTFMPWRAVDKYYRYWGMGPEVRQYLASKSLGRSLVLVRGERQPDFASAIAYNPVNLSADAPIFAYESDDATRAELLAAYPDRQLWILDGPSRTKTGYHLSGPITRELFLCACSTQQEQPEGPRR
jgi:hypothetical protein